MMLSAIYIPSSTAGNVGIYKFQTNMPYTYGVNKFGVDQFDVSINSISFLHYYVLFYTEINVSQHFTAV